MAIKVIMDMNNIIISTTSTRHPSSTVLIVTHRRLNISTVCARQQGCQLPTIPIEYCSLPNSHG